jgi:hypothetical protein
MGLPIRSGGTALSSSPLGFRKVSAEWFRLRKNRIYVVELKDA